MNPAIARLASKLMDKMINRSLSLVISEREKFGDGPLSLIQKDIDRNKYQNITAWRDAVLKVFEINVDDSDVVKEVKEEYTFYFNKRYLYIQRLDSNCFKDMLTEISKDVKDLVNYTLETESIQKPIENKESTNVEEAHTAD